jgi:hypothetical protein
LDFFHGAFQGLFLGLISRDYFRGLFPGLIFNPFGRYGLFWVSGADLFCERFIFIFLKNSPKPMKLLKKIL